MEKSLSKLYNNFSLFKKLDDIKKAVDDIQDACDIGEHCIAFIIAEYGIHMYIKQIHKSIPTYIRTKFFRPKMLSIKDLEKVYMHYMDQYYDVIELMSDNQNYYGIVDYHKNDYREVIGNFAYDNTTKMIDIPNYGSRIVSRDEDCRGGYVTYSFGPLFKMCRRTQHNLYYCYCDSDY